MKKFFMFAAMASVAFASCVKNEPAINLEQENLISFNSPVVGVVTKAPNAAVVDGVNYPENTPFVVNAWYMQDGTSYAGNGTRYMREVATEMVAGDGSNLPYYKPVTPYYWPKNGTLSFIAYSPAILPANCDADGVDAENTFKDKLEIHYVTPNDASQQVDLMYSDWATDREASVDGNGKYQGLDIVFKHALSVVKVYINAVDAETAAAVRIGTVKLNKIHSTATFTSEFNKTAAWSEAATDDTYTMLNVAQSAATADGVTTAEAGALIEGSAGTTQYCNYILMPQTLDDDATLTIDYYLKHGNSWLPQNATLNLNAAKKADDTVIAKWNMSTKYSYNVSIKLNPIFFAPAIVDWSSETSTWDITE